MRNIRHCCVRRSGGPYPPGGGRGGAGEGAAGAAPSLSGSGEKGASVVRQELQAPAVTGLGPAPGGEQVRKRATGKNRSTAGEEFRPGNPAVKVGSQRADQGETPEMPGEIRKGAEGKPEGSRKGLRRERDVAAKQGKIEIMEVRALTKNVRISPEKARHISRLIQGKSAVEALAIVDLSPRKAAALIGDTLRSAVANAENNKDINRKLLTVKAALVSPGPIIRRFRPKARGSAGRIRKRTSHFEVILTDNQ